MLIGKQHSGKTLMALKTAGNFQKKYNGVDYPKKYVVWVNVGEGLFPKAWAEKNGVDIDDLVLIEPPDGEAAVDLTCAAMEEEDVCLVIFDAIPGIVTANEIEKSAVDATKPGMIAAPLQRMLRKCSTIVAKSRANKQLKTMILINQWRDGIAMTGVPVARTVPGGKYARHYNSVEIEMYNKEVVGKAADSENGVQIVATNEHSFNIHKNKTGNSIRSGEFELARAGSIAGTILDHGTVVTYAKKYGLRGGAGKGQWMVDPETGEELHFDKVDDMEQYLINDPVKFDAMKRLIISKHRKTQGLSETGWF